MLARRIFSIILGTLSIVWLVLGLAITTDHDTIDWTIEQNVKIDIGLREASKFVDEYIETNARLPTDDELNLYTGPNGYSSLMRVRSPEHILRNDIFDDAIKEFGKPPPDSYLISQWRGECHEYYSSWLDSTSLSVEKSDYYWFGKPIYGQSLVVVIFIISVFVAILVWSPTKNKQTKL